MRFLTFTILVGCFYCVSAQKAVINEVVTAPVFNYSDAGYTNTSDTNSVSEIDEWLEILILKEGLNLNNWTIELLDGSDVTGDLSSSGAFQFSDYRTANGGDFTDTDSADFLVLGNVTGNESMSNSITIRLLDNEGNLVDEVTLGTDPGEAPFGNSRSAEDEAVARIPDGYDTNSDADDFIETVATPGTPNSKRGKVLINELVTDPLKDWSSTGYSIPADSGGTISDIDDWLELYIAEDSLNLAKWEILLSSTDDVTGDLSDTGAFQFSNYISNTNGSSFFNTAEGDYLVLGNVSGPARSLLNTGDFILKNAYGEIVDQVRLISGEAPNGNSTSLQDEAVARLPNATDTDDNTNDFGETYASPGFFNSYKTFDQLREKALNLNGDSVLLEWDMGVLQDAFTTSFWLKIEDSDETENIIKQQNGTLLIALDQANRIQSYVTGEARTTSESLEPDSWNHITLRKADNTFTLFLNGKNVLEWSETSVLNQNPVVLGPAHVSLEELKVWDYALTEDTIKKNLHLIPEALNGLVHYYQFNEQSNQELISGSGIQYTAGISFKESDAPVSSGKSVLFTDTSTGPYDLNSTVENHSLNIQFKEDKPAGDLVISFLNETPEKTPSGLNLNDGTWIVEYYGTESDFDANLSFNFPKDYLITQDTSTYFLYRRSSNSTANWKENKTNADSVVLNDTIRKVSFSGIKNLGQFLVASNESPLPIQFLDFYLLTKSGLILLKWEFENREKIKAFNIEKSNNVSDFCIIDSIDPDRTSYTDSASNKHIQYYRIAALNYEDERIYSKIIFCMPEDKPGKKGFIYPSPVKRYLYISTNEVKDIHIYNTNGEELSVQFKTLKRRTKVSFKSYKKGMYILEIMLSEGARIERVFKN